MTLPNARQVASAAIAAAKLPLKAAGLAGTIAFIGLELIKDSYRQHAEARRIRIIDKRRRAHEVTRPRDHAGGR